MGLHKNLIMGFLLGTILPLLKCLPTFILFSLLDRFLPIASLLGIGLAAKISEVERLKSQ